jgi:hypothetical protein
MKTSLLVLGLFVLVVAGCVTAHSWEYRTRTTSKRLGPNMLNGYGKSGWELVQVIQVPVLATNADHVKMTNIEFQYIFKRPKH